MRKHRVPATCEICGGTVSTTYSQSVRASNPELQKSWMHDWEMQHVDPEVCDEILKRKGAK